MTWIRIVQYITATSIGHLAAMKSNSIRFSFSIFQFGMGNDYPHLATKLENAGKYDHDLSIVMITGFIDVSLSSGGMFNFTL